MRIFRIFVVCLVIAQMILPQHASIPGWWTNDSAHTRIIAPGVSPSNYSPVNLGQLKFVAAQAKKHLDIRLAPIGGAGSEINALVAGFEPRAGQNYTAQQLAAIRLENYAPVNIGQLKAVAKPFYQRLITVGYNTRVNLIAHGYPGPPGTPGAWAFNFPWNPNEPWNQPGTADKSPNYAVANIGQLKMAFSFDLDAVSDAVVIPGSLLQQIEHGMAGPNPPPAPPGDGGNTPALPIYGVPSPGGGGGGVPLDPDHDPSKTPMLEWPTALGGGVVELNWNAGGGEILEVALQRRQPNTAWVTIATFADGTTQANDTGLQANATYLYRIAVGHADGSLAYSNVVDALLPFATSYYQTVAYVAYGKILSYGEDGHTPQYESAPDVFADMYSSAPEYSDWFRDPGSPEWVSRGFRPPPDDIVAFYRLNIQIDVNPGASMTVPFYAVFVPIIEHSPGNDGSEPPATPEWESAQLASPSPYLIEAGPSSAEYSLTIDPSVEPDAFQPGTTNGMYTLLQGLQIAAIGSIPDNTGGYGSFVSVELDGPTRADGTAIVRAADGNGKGTVEGQFSIPENYVSDYFIEISNSADFTVRDGSGSIVSSGTKVHAGVFTVTPNQSATPNEQVQITVTAGLGSVFLGSDTVTFTNVPPRPPAVPFHEVGGTRYRKIALNGRPLADEKPQQTPESDQEKEQTYVDALNLTLQHSVTDIYVPIPGADLALSVRRNYTSDVWNFLDGLRPHERPDRPFGAGWSSNLCVSLEYEGNYVYVTDANGSRHQFVMNYDGVLHIGNNIPLPSDARENGDYLVSLSNDGTVFTDRYGTKIYFDFQTPLITTTTDSSGGIPVSDSQVFYRASKIVDRYGNTINYAYPSLVQTLIPSTISVAGAQNLTISIEQDDIGHITRIWDPNGNQYTYTYSDVSNSFEGVTTTEKSLSQVQAPGGNTTNYGYSISQEQDPLPEGSGSIPEDQFHLDLAQITDASQNSYGFTYTFNHSRVIQGPGEQYFYAVGGNSCVSRVDLPGNLGHAAFSLNDSTLEFDGGDLTGRLFLTADSKMVVSITDAGGNSVTYNWTDGQGAKASAQGPVFDTGQEVLFFTKEEIVYAGGSESFTFNPAAGMALASTTDFSHNTTQFTYGDAYTPPGNWVFNQLLGYQDFGLVYADPTQQTDALTNTRTFHYADAAHFRIMDRVTDENNRVKTYQIDDLGRHTNELIYTAGTDSPVVQETDFTFGSTAFPGVVTQKRVRKLNGPAWAHDMVVKYDLDGNGRVARQIVDPDGLALVTQYTYDHNGNKLSVTDPKIHTTGFEYDTQNRLTKVVYPDGSAKTTTYYPNGTKSSLKDENQNITAFTYDALKRPLTQTRTVKVNGSPTSLVTRYGYTDAVQPKTSVTDPNLHTTTMQYDGLQRLTQTTDALGHTTNYDYSGPNAGAHVFDVAGFKPTRITDSCHYQTNFTYDPLYHVTGKSVQYQHSPALYADTLTRYDGVGNAVETTDPLLHRITTQYDALDRVTGVTYVDEGTTNAFSYTPTGLKWQVKDELEKVTETHYDAAGRPVTVLGPEVDDGLDPASTDRTGHMKRPCTRTIYDPAGNVAATINPRQKRWDYLYDARNRKVEEDQPAVTDAVTGQVIRPVIRTGYDYVGNILWTQDARGFTSETTYDEVYRPTQFTSPPVLLAGGTEPVRPITSKTYDAVGNVLTVTNADGPVTNAYNEINQLTSTTDAAGITVHYGYDAVGNRTSVRDGLNQTTTLCYDGLNRNTLTKDAAGHSTQLSYDAQNKTARIDANHQTTQYHYDSRNRLTTVTYPSSVESYGYDAVGNLLSVQESGNAAATVGYTYDALGRVTTETSNGATHIYNYDLAGNRLSVRYGLAGGGHARSLISSYDDLNRLQTLTDGNLTSSYTYDLGGNVITKTLPNGDQVTTRYDGLNRAYEEEGVSSQGLLYHYLSLADAVGNLRSSTEFAAGLPARTVVLGYDADDRLTSEIVSDGSGATVGSTTYGYDAANNRQTRTANGVTTDYAYNDLNQLTAWTDTAGHSASYTYDSNGNRLTRSAGGATDTYSYDTENCLVGLAKNTTDQPSTVRGAYGYSYDYRTRRIARSENAATTQVVFSGETSVQEYPAIGALGVEYVRGSDWGGGVSGILYSVREGVASFAHYNQRGDVTARTDGTGIATWQASYEAFGTRPAEYGATQERQKANTKEEDPTGLLNEGMRYRDLETGTFITRDPAGFVDGPNLYAYVRQNPWTKFDPFGLDSNTNTENEDNPDGMPIISDPIFTLANGLFNGIKDYVNDIAKDRMAIAEYRKQHPDIAAAADQGFMLRANAAKQQMQSYFDAKNREADGLASETEASAKLAQQRATLEAARNLQAAQFDVNSREQKLYDTGVAVLSLFINPAEAANGGAQDLITVFRVEGAPNTRLAIDGAGRVGVNSNSTVWLNFGDDVRAGNYLTQKLDRGLPGVQVKGFQVPRTYLDSLNGRLVPERGSRLFPNNPIQSPDGPGQIGLRPSLLPELQQNIVPGSGFTMGGF